MASSPKLTESSWLTKTRNVSKDRDVPARTSDRTMHKWPAATLDVCHTSRQGHTCKKHSSQIKKDKT